jgi:hypothetical protein
MTVWYTKGIHEVLGTVLWSFFLITRICYCWHYLWSTTVRIRVTVRLRLSTSPLFALFTCCWMSFEAVLGNKEFELVVFGVTFAVVTIQQHVNSANSGDVDNRNLTVTLIRTVVLQRSWYQMPGCSVQCKMNKNTHGYMTHLYLGSGSLIFGEISA